MPIYIAKDYEGKTIDIVLAKERQSAEIYWQGKGITACFVDERSEADLDDHPTGVMPIVTTVEKEFHIDGKFKEVIMSSNDKVEILIIDDIQDHHEKYSQAFYEAMKDMNPEIITLHPKIDHCDENAANACIIQCSLEEFEERLIAEGYHIPEELHISTKDPMDWPDPDCGSDDLRKKKTKTPHHAKPWKNKSYFGKG